MAVKIRLRRMGSKNRPHSRVVVADNKMPRDGRHIEELGYYDPARDLLHIDKERAEYWLSVGAQPSETVRSLLKKLGIAKPATKKA